MRTIFRSSAVILALWASTAQAERQLDRAEITAIVRDYAVCYEESNGSCYAAEFFENVGDETLEVTYTFEGNDGISVVTEQAFWNDNQICVHGDSRGVLRAWTIFRPDRRFEFDLSNATELSGFAFTQLKSSYDQRDGGYCYGWMSDDAGYTNLRTVYGDAATGGTAPLRFVPRSEGSLVLN